MEINETGIFNVKDQRPGTNPSYTIYTVIVHIAEGTNYYAARASARAVSYTHIDVYKRQGKTRKITLSIIRT